MNSYALYNEIDPFAAQWLRELIKQGHIAPGIVDERSIEDVTPNDLAGFTQCHFFAGIGVWSYALRQAGWPDDRPIWTGSAPCQPFSSAGKGGGFDDERHLWPAFHWLIDQCRPDIVLGEQVAGKDGLTWLDLVSTDLEGSGYAVGASVTAACGFGAPHQRKRLYWVGIDPLANTEGQECPSRDYRGSGTGAMSRGSEEKGVLKPDSCLSSGGMADTASQGSQGGISRREDEGRGDQHGYPGCGSTVGRPGPTNGFWRDADWLGCRDEKWRPVEPGTFPLAHGASSRVGRLRGYGNGLVAQQAQAFIEAFMQK